MFSGAMVSKPFSSKFKVISCVISVGGLASSTVTTAVVALLFPAMSVTVKVTVFSPISAHVKSVRSRASAVKEQLSVEPLFISAGTITAFPLASNCTVISWLMATGSIWSCTVTSAFAVDVLPLLSVTVKVTMLGFVATSEQLKSVLSSSKDAIPKSSFEPLSTSSAFVEPVPEASNSTTTFCAIAVGFTLSCTSIFMLYEEVLIPPRESTTLKVKLA